MHPNAMPAARAAYCAGQQKPEYFWSMHDWLFAQQSRWSSLQPTESAKQFRAQAVSFGVDGTAYDACVTSPATDARLQKDTQEGTALGVQGTPAFFINDWFINGAVPISEFKDKIESASKGLHPAPTATPLPAGVQFYDADPSRPGMTYSGSPMLGDAKAPLVLIAFEDFQCSYCAQSNKDVAPTLREKYIKTGKLRMVFEFFPTYAPNSAVAGLCALRQGKFWEYHDALYERQADWKDDDRAALVKYATALGIDEAKFKACLDDPAVKTQANDNYELGQQVGVTGTPYFLLLNAQKQTGVRIPGAVPLSQFEDQINKVLNPGATPAATPAK